jgi:hypothetical protein
MKRERTVVQGTIIALGLVALLATLTITGCTQQRQWTKQGLNQAEFEQDAARCRRDAARATYQDPFAGDSGQGLERSVAQEKFFEQCMFSKGYRLESGASEK